MQFLGKNKKVNLSADLIVGPRREASNIILLCPMFQVAGSRIQFSEMAIILQLWEKRYNTECLFKCRDEKRFN